MVNSTDPLQEAASPHSEVSVFENPDVNCSKCPLEQGTEENAAFTVPVARNEKVLVLMQ